MTTSTDPTQETLSFSAQEILDTFPKAWTRGLLYFLISFIIIVLPWAMLSKVDEVGTAKGKLEPKGDTVKIDSPISGEVETILVKEGNFVEFGQPILTLNSQLIQTELQQVEKKLVGQKNRLFQLDLLKKQLQLSLSNQQQQNQSQELEKKAQISQAIETVSLLMNKAELQKSEKLAQVNQATVALDKSKTDTPIVKSRYEASLDETKRYQKVFEEGVVSESQVFEKEDRAREIQRLYLQGKADINQNQQRLVESTSLYQQIVKQVNGDIYLSKLKLQEQQKNYESLKHSNQLALLKIKDQLNNTETEIATVKSEIAQIHSQIKSLQIQLAQRVIKAKISGTIFQLPIKKAGAVVQVGSRVAEIAPQQYHLILKSQIATDQSGFLKTGLPVKLKFDAYPFQDYGMVNGKLVAISPTTSEMDTPNGKATAYQLEIELDKTCISKDNQCINLHPGDTATAEVIVRQRKVIDFVLDPFKKLQKDGLKL